LIIAGGLVSVPAVWLMGQTRSLWLLTAFSATWYFLGGMTLALLSVLAGLYAEETERGRVFGYALTGSAIQYLGLNSALAIVASLPLLALGLLTRV
jgi:hypothetical protein